MLRVLHDIRGNWSVDDYKRECDLIICSSSRAFSPIPGKRALAHVGCSVLFWHGELDEYNAALYAAIGGETGLIQPRQNVLLNDPDQEAYAIDLNARGIVDKLVAFWVIRFASLSGIHLDYATSLEYLLPQLVYDWEKYSNMLNAVTRGLHYHGFLVTQQQYHYVPPIYTYTNGLYHEKWPGQFNQTFLEITAATKRFMEQIKKIDPDREFIDIMELRYPNNFSTNYKNVFKAWVEGNGYYASIGRNETAGVGL